MDTNTRHKKEFRKRLEKVYEQIGIMFFSGQVTVAKAITLYPDLHLSPYAVGMAIKAYAKKKGIISNFTIDYDVDESKIRTTHLDSFKNLYKDDHVETVGNYGKHRRQVYNLPTS